MTVREATRILGVSRKTVHRWIEHGLLNHWIENGQKHVSRDQVCELVNKLDKDAYRPAGRLLWSRGLAGGEKKEALVMEPAGSSGEELDLEEALPSTPRKFKAHMTKTGISYRKIVHEDHGKWQDQAACKDYENPDVFFANEAYNVSHSANPDVQIAKRVCASCPVQLECLRFALKHEDTSTRFGIWGGKTVVERTQIVKLAKSSRLARQAI